MNESVTESLMAEMDATADWMHSSPPPFPTVANAVGIPPCRPPKLYTQNGLRTPFSKGITIPTREQGEADMHRRDSIRRGGI